MVDAVGCTLLRVLHGGHTEFAQNVALSRDGTRLASYEYRGRVVVWDVARAGAWECFHSNAG